MDRKNELLIRVYFVLAVFILFACIILGRVIKITMVEGDKWRKAGGVNVKLMDKPVDRGNIYDTNGNLLATSLPYFDIRLDLLVSSDATFNDNVDSLSICLAKLWPHKKSASEWKSELIGNRHAGKRGTKKGTSYHIIANDISLDQLEKLKKFPLLREGRYRGGLIVERKSKRKKPFKEIASRTIGEDRYNSDKIGIEGSFDKFLKGKTEQQLMKRIPPNLWVPVINPAEFDAKKGDDVVTTIDMHYQDIMHIELLRGLKTQNAKAGSAILMEVETGAIKAISNLSRTEDGNYAESYNYGIGWLSEPGSTIKTAAMLALIEEGCISLNEMVQVNGGKKKFYGEWMYDSEKHGKDEMTISEAFKLSSNVGIATAVDDCFRGPERVAEFVNYYKQFGLHEKTGIEIQGEGTPFVKDPVKQKSTFWKTTVPWMAHGYEMHQTPLQVLSFYNTIANDGQMMKPYLVNSILRDNEVLHDFQPKVVNQQIAKPESIGRVQDLLKGVVMSGTGSRLKTDEFSFAGKTGTTRVDYSIETEFKKYNASFAGYFPAENPKYSMIVVVYEPRVSYYGSSVAGPIFRKIAEKCHSFFYKEGEPVDVKKMDEFLTSKKHNGHAGDYNDLMAYMEVGYERNTNSRWVKVVPSEEDLLIDKKTIVVGEVPDVRGMGIRDATYVLESLGLSVRTDGVGKVAKQSLKAGTEISGQQIELTLN